MGRQVHKYVILIPEVLFPTCFRYLANIEAILKGSKSSKVIEIRDSRAMSIARVHGVGRWKPLEYEVNPTKQTNQNWATESTGSKVYALEITSMTLVKTEDEIVVHL
jgi:hypothetical protein